MPHSRLSIIALAFTIAVLTACGGGSGGSGGVSSPAMPPVMPPVTPPATPPVTPAPSGFDRPVNAAANAPLASIDSATGKLFYGAYANQGQTNTDHIIPDFSYAGYGGGGVALPSYDFLPVRETLFPQAGDDLARVQAALDRVGALPVNASGVRGVVLLTSGAYDISGTLSIPASGVILRGEGQGPAGTVLRATTTQADAIFIEATGAGGGDNPAAAADDRRVAITQSYVPVGTAKVEVASAAGYAAGDKISVRRTPNDFWLGTSGVNTAQYGWEANRYDVGYQRTVTAVDGNTITFDVPLTDTIEDQYGGGEVYRIDTSGRLSQIGIENLRVQTRPEMINANRNRAVDAIEFTEVEQSWIRDVTVRYFNHGITFNAGVHYVTAQDVAHIDPDFEVVGGNHYAFDFGSGGQNLFNRCYSEKSRHAFTSGSTPAGPNVFLDCYNKDGTNDSGPHQRWAAGTLFDNTADDLIRVQNRTTSGSGHGWAGAQQMLWNGRYDEIVLQAPPGAMNWAVGNTGTRISGSFSPSEPDGIFESAGNNVTPRSLYLQQLEDRLGAGAVNNVTKAVQRSGTIYTQLETWRGDGPANY